MVGTVALGCGVGPGTIMEDTGTGGFMGIPRGM